MPWASGGVDHDQGISKAGHPVIRKHLVQMEWCWLRWQPDSVVAKWFDQYFAHRNGGLPRASCSLRCGVTSGTAWCRRVRCSPVP